VNKQRIQESLIGLGAGLLFGVGLAISGMTQPSKVVGFLDVTGNWDPSLAFVMLGAVLVYFVSNRLVARRKTPLFGDGFHLPTRRDLEPKLIAGAALFGIGWGLGGYCPGPGITSLGAGLLTPVLFVAAMAAGMWIHDALDRGPRPTKQ
jgi:uncharacterized protein